ncbi:MAG TPA: hypothetical protein VF407_19390, partial [Polyangiaceae bacterium]
MRAAYRSAEKPSALFGFEQRFERLHLLLPRGVAAENGLVDPTPEGFELLLDQGFLQNCVERCTFLLGKIRGHDAGFWRRVPS